MELLKCYLSIFLLVGTEGQGLPFPFEFSNKLLPVGPRKGYWSPWNLWTACSRTCGGGVTFRNRYCLHQSTLTDLSNCEGVSKEYNLCNTEPCPGGSVNFRAIQCSMYDGLDYYGVVRHWSPLKEANDGCNLLCEKNVDATNTISRNLGVVVDGTQCRKNNGGGVCIKGQCRSVGCDNQLDSLMRYDSCGECGGTNHSCGFFSGKFTTKVAEEELFHYYDVLTFQPGTTNITVEEASDVNYLAVSVNDRFYLNGNWAVNHPGTFTVAGAPFTYQRRRDGYEKITSPGPVNSVVQISIIVRTENPVVLYQYYVPPMQHEQPEVPTDLGNTIGSNTAIVDEPVNSLLVPVVDETVTEKDNSQEDKTESAKKSDKSEKSKTKNKKKKPGRQQKEPKKKKKPTKQEVKELCGPCARVKGKVRNFCHSDFVVHAMILDRVVGTNMTRYDVQILQTFTNNVMLFSREYIWVPNLCQCPRLKIGRDYLIMGDRVQSATTRENLLMVDRDKMVIRWNPTKFDLWDSIQSTSNAKCYKLLKKESKKSRN